MKAAMRLKNQRYPKLELDKLNYENVTSLAEFDDQVTAPLHGYTSGQDYYDRASTLSDLRNLETRTHIIFACNDPFFSKRCIPADDKQSVCGCNFRTGRTRWGMWLLLVGISRSSVVTGFEVGLRS